MTTFFDKLLDSAVQTLDDSYDLIYIDYRDELSDNQVKALVADNFEAFWDDLADWECEARSIGARYVSEDVMDNLKRWCDEQAYPVVWRNAFDEHEYDLQDSIEDAICERESGDWLEDLAKNTPDVTVMIPLIDEDYAEWGTNRSVDQMVEALNVTDSPENISILDTLLAEAPTDLGMMWALVQVPVIDLLDHEQSAFNFDKAVVCYGNPFTGGYFGETMQGLNLEVKRKDIMLDGAWGYDFEDVYGDSISNWL